MNHMNHVNWAALVEYEAKQRAHAQQERLFDDIRRDEHENVQKRQWKLNSPEDPVRWRLLKLRSALARLL